MPLSKGEALLARAASQQRESKYVDFKESFDPAVAGEWCELVKDFAAFANSGGGMILVGVRNNGTIAGVDISAVLAIDPAVITDKLFRYTGMHAADFEVHEVTRDEVTIAAITIGGVTVPLVFTRPGTYETTPGTQKTAFSKGTIYFRHGAKSEPANGDDIRTFIDSRIEAARTEWQANVRRVMEAPADAQVAVYRRTSSDESDSPPSRIQLTTDPHAPIYGKLDADETHPYRQTDLVAEVSRRLTELGLPSINRFDVLAVRRVHGLDETSSPEFCHQPRFASMQYSETFMEWMLAQYEKDDQFFQRARKSYRAKKRGSR